MRILVVDDEEDLRGLLRRLLMARGHDVLTAAGPVEALELALLHEPDLLITDIDMAGGPTGITLASHLTERQPTLPVIFMSGRPHVTELPRGSVLLAKPFSSAALLDTVMRLQRG